MSKDVTFLSDQERNQVATFVSNKVMREAVRKVLLSGIYYNGTLKKGEDADPYKNFMLTPEVVTGMSMVNGHPVGGLLSDEEVGKLVRAQGSGIRMLEQAFDEMDKFLPVKENKTSKKNPAL